MPFATKKLNIEKAKNSLKQPVVLVACGSFSPVTYLHLRMFELAKDRIEDSKRFELIGGYFSPVSDSYMKNGLALHTHRIKMCELAVEDSDWIMVDEWEGTHAEYVRTVKVLDYFQDCVNQWVERESIGRNVRVILLAGGDLVESFGIPGLWADADLEKIMGIYGCLIVERTGVDLKGFLLEHDIAYKNRQHIHNDISSTKIRLFIKRGLSIKYLLPEEVIRYIYDHNLYTE
ncbi:Nucleotidylyl transferase [Rozella allomycis CSF55]|uniref:Nicotinamide-nucleotide adenylyltransferase n=1 Tax=Rozella allomycis (strain CSF55) TaxID=988480 RepID=A0A4P9YRE0_ROZAC|nr:Nucleotidylyl transferase [Rozella allomycis CSF55]